MKKTILIALGLILLLAACDRKAFVKILVGTWKVDKYLFAGQTNTYAFDTVFRDWKLRLDQDQIYTKTWTNYYIFPDSLFVVDTLGYDTSSSTYIVRNDTSRHIDTTITARMELGKWELINSEEDLQLRNDSGNAVEIYRILELTKNNLNLRKGNEEFHLKK